MVLAETFEVYPTVAKGPRRFIQFIFYILGKIISYTDLRGSKKTSMVLSETFEVYPTVAGPGLDDN